MLTINGAFAVRNQGWPIYALNANAPSREQLRDSLRIELRRISEWYQLPVHPEDHFQRVFEFANTLTALHADVLHGGRFRIGVAQKALNLYLKYLWCLGEILIPAHCPFDNKVIKHLRPHYGGPNWTELDSETDYQRLVEIANLRACHEGGLPLAEWELQLWPA